ncbi:uncharacterized protein MJAP1_003935 [Malassezia japonica]|uniref:DUF202 domain-containing protein n=1 Tax=Malassezia japonica TaxID=223818 RepID=A0AAF0F5I5_9BASI|nr:uncharacterized protein MJAP1_003935 [Malassezia japonica]WFD40944.1 hypothetical protein MJAP1_003935 [Malassezia japonica]
MSTAQTSSSSDGGYLSRLYERASHLIHNAGPQSEEQQPLLHGQRSSTEYGSVPENQIPVPKPRKVQSPVKVEAKVWFANERTWISWLRASILMGTLSLALFNSASYFDPEPVPPPFEPGPGMGGNSRAAKTVRTFGIIYALISVLVLLWGLYNYQRRVTLIKSRWAGSFDDLIGPPLVCGVTFIAILANFIVTDI